MFIEVTEAVTGKKSLFNLNKISVIRNIHGVAWLFQKHENASNATEVVETYAEVKALIEKEVATGRGY